MPFRIFVLLLLVVHVSMAVRLLSKANRVMSSLGQHGAQRKLKEERATASPKMKSMSKRFPGQRVVQGKVSEGTVNITRTKASPDQNAVSRREDKEAVSSARTHMPFTFYFIVICISCCAIIFCCCRGAALVSGFFFTHNPLVGNYDSATDNSDLEWCHPDTIAAGGSMKSDIEIIAPDWNAESLSGVLQAHDLNVGHIRGSVFKWTEKQLGHFAKELSKGKARLATEDKSLFRLVDMLIVLVVYERDGLVLQKFAPPEVPGIASKDKFNIKECTVKSKLISNEGLIECAERCVQKLGSSVAGCIKIVPDILGMREERRILHSAHPGLRTLMQQYVVEARVIATDESDLKALGLLSESLHVAGSMYRWVHLDTVPAVKKHLKKSWEASRRGAIRWKGISHSFLPVLPWTENAVLEKLHERGFPARGSVPPDVMKTLLRALNEGRVSLAFRSGNPLKLSCVQEKVSVVVKSLRKAMILTSGFSNDGAPILPTIQRHASESKWRAAVRLSQKNLKLSTPLFQMEGRLVAVFDEVEDQKDLQLITRVHVLHGPLIDTDFAHT